MGTEPHHPEHAVPLPPITECGTTPLAVLVHPERSMDEEVVAWWRYTPDQQSFLVELRRAISDAVDRSDCYSYVVLHCSNTSGRFPYRELVRLDPDAVDSLGKLCELMRSERVGRGA